MITNLRFFCQRVLPVVYDDSLSYQELLYKVIGKINEIIPEVNKLDDDLVKTVEDMLNEWIETGIIPDIIADLPIDILTPEIFGAVGDGITDDTQALQDAVNYSIRNHVPLVSKNKTYLITDTLTFYGFRDQNTDIVEFGDRMNINLSGSVIKFTGTGYALDLSMLEYGYLNFGTLESADGGIRFYTPDRWHYISYFILEGISIKAIRECIFVLNENSGWCNQVQIKNIRFAQGQYSIHWYNNSTNVINEWFMDHCILEGVSEGYYIESNSEENINIYTSGFAFFYDRVIEHTAAGRHYLITKGRCTNITIFVDHAPLDQPAYYDFQYDGPNTQTYTHIANEVFVIGPVNITKFQAGKRLERAEVIRPANAQTPITSVDSIGDARYSSHHGTVSEYRTLDPTLNDFYPDGIGTQLMIDETLWYGGRVTNPEDATSQLVLHDQYGTDLIKPIYQGTPADFWLRNIVALSEKRTPLNDTEITYQKNSICLLIIANPTLTFYEVWLVKFGSVAAPVKLLGTGTESVITQTNNRSLHFTNSSYPNATLSYALIPIMG